MPVLPAAESLLKRDTCYNNGGFYGGGYYYTCNSAWYTWGRWVLFGVLVGLAILLFLSCACITSRRRRRAGQTPIYGTGWASGNHGTPQYQQPPQQTSYYNSGPPAYQPQPNQGANSDYYGPQSGGVQQPQPAYGGYAREANSTVYDPPKDAPPPPSRY